MKAKTIKAVLRKKLDAWLDTIDDETLRAKVAKNTIVTGGCIASMLLREKVNDIDVYFRDRTTTQAVAEYYVKRFKEAHPLIPTAVKNVDLYVDTSHEDRIAIYAKSAGIVGEESGAVVYDYFEGRAPDEAGDYVSEVMDDPGEITDKLNDVKEALEPDDTKPKYRPVFLSTNAITLANQIQLIIRFYGEPDQIHENYDFVHCTNYYDAGSGELVLRKEALEALLTRELRYVGSKYPLCSIIRVRKFVGRGWSINAGQILKMAMQLNAMDLTDFNVLRDQLTGVDVAYFSQVIQAVKDKDPEKVNTAYLLDIVDRMFWELPMRAILILGVLAVAACGHRDDGGYSQARSTYMSCLQSSSDCRREQQVYMLMANDRQLRQSDQAILVQTQANTSAWARWYMGR